MIEFEQAFADTEKAASSTVKSASDVAKLARGLEKAAKTGNINALKRARAELNAALSVLAQEVANATQAWPYQPDDEETYVKEHFAEELRKVAAAQGLEIHRRDEQLIAHPSIVRVLPAARAVRIDRKQVSTIRPSHLTGLLQANQRKPARFNGRRFLEAVHKAYRMLLGSQEPLRRLEAGRLPPVPLANIYEALTLMPGLEQEYSRTEFAQALYRLDVDGPHETRSGAQLNFHSGRQSAIAFVAPDGHIITYHSIAFSEVGNG